MARLKKVVYDKPDSKLGGVRIELTFENCLTTDDVYKVLRPDTNNFIWWFMELFQFTPILVMENIISKQPIRTHSRSQTYVIEVAICVRNYNSNQSLSSDARNRPESFKLLLMPCNLRAQMLRAINKDMSRAWCVRLPPPKPYDNQVSIHNTLEKPQKNPMDHKMIFISIAKTI